LKVSRTPVREALNRLVIEGLMTFVPNKGFYCRDFDADEILHLFEVRATLETRAVELACQRASDEELLALRDWWREVEGRSSGLSASDLTRHDETFHLRIAAVARNPELGKLLAAINARIRFVRRIEIEADERRATTFREHREIADALVSRANAEARELMSRHLEVSVADAVGAVKEGLARIYMSKRRA
jgi:DNA-binding GntR family transcriptional regulator